MIFERLRKIIIERTGKNEDSITLETNLKSDFTLDSLDMLQIIGDIEDEFGIEFDEADEFETVGDAVKYIENTNWS